MPDVHGMANVAQGSAVIAERHVLCVDDDHEFIKSLESFLPKQINAQPQRGIWFRCLFFENPREALDTLKELVASGETVAMVISDQMMPEMKGTEFLGQAERISPQSVRVLLTGHAGIESAILAINERLLDKYLTKPIDDEKDFAVSILHLLQRFDMKRTIEGQAAVIRDLYEFAKTLNGIDTLDGTLRSIAEFTASALQCDQAFVLAADSSGAPRGHGVGTAEHLEEMLDLSQAASGASHAPNGDDVRFVAESSELAGELLDGDEAIRCGLRFPLLLAPVYFEVATIGVIGAGACRGNGIFDDHQRRTLSFIVDTASVALRKQRVHEELRRAYAEIHRHAETLAEANRRLRILDDLRGEFLTFISHELATPLSLIAGVDLLGEGGADANRAPVLQGIREGYDRLSGFVEKSLRYFTLLSEEPDHSDETVDLAELVGEAMQDRDSDDRARVTIAAGQAPCWARIPKADLREVFDILIVNALKYSEEKAGITVAFETGSEAVTLTISDEGRGFPPEWAPELFRPFTVADTDHHHRGFAVSLAIASAILHSHHGSIKAKSAGWDRGATFTVQIPTVHI